MRLTAADTPFCDAHILNSATRLYERAGMRATLHVAVYQKELRHGLDISTLSLA